MRETNGYTQINNSIDLLEVLEVVSGSWLELRLLAQSTG